MRKTNLSVGVLGLWHLGCVYAASFAELGYTVTGFDLDPQNIDNLKRGIPPISEPGLDDVITKTLGKHLFFSSEPKEAISHKKYVFVTLDVPVSDQDKTNLKPLNKLFDLLIKHASPKTKIVISSQVPLGTSRSFLKRISKKHPTIDVIYFPENIRLGAAFQTFLNADRIILGLEKDSVQKQFIKDFPNFTCPVYGMNLESAEMVKHALNSFLAVNISFASEISDLCEMLGANYDDVVKALRADARIGPNSPLNPGTGFAGGTIGRDVQNLRMLVRGLHYKPLLLSAAYKVNQNRLIRLVEKVETIYPKLSGKKIGILGLTYKPNTNTLRRSKSLELAKILFSKKAAIFAFDPAIKESIPSHRYITVSQNRSTFFRGLDLLIVMTPWPEFKEISKKEISKMKKKMILDTNNLLSEDEMRSFAVKYFRTGRKFP